MRRRERFLLVFFVLLSASVGILLVSSIGNLQVFSVLERAAAPIGIKVYSAFHKLQFIKESKKEKKEKEKKVDVAVLVSEIEKLKKENAALKDQFQTTNPKSVDLLPAKIVGSPGFIPGVTNPQDLIVDKGEIDNVKVGDTVVFKNNLIGKIVKVSLYLSKVELIFNSSSSFTAKTIERGVFGLIKGDGNEVIFDNVLLSDKIEVDGIVVTKADLDLEGVGIPPDLIVGKIKSIDKDLSSLFQKAKIESFVDFKSLEVVFILGGQ